MKQLLHLCTIALLLFSCTEKNTPVVKPSVGIPTTTTPVQPTASFNYTKGDDVFEVQFTNQSKNYKSLSWDFGDGITSTRENPTHVYSAAGTYTVTLTATNETLKDRATCNFTLTEPTKCYVTGVCYDEVAYLGKYYRCKLDDDGPWVVKTWVKTGYMLVDDRRMDYIFQTPVLLENIAKHDYYTLYAYWSDNTSKDGTQLLKQKIYKSQFSGFPSKISKTSDNGSTTVWIYLKWY